MNRYPVEDEMTKCMETLQEVGETLERLLTIARSRSTSLPTNDETILSSRIYGVHTLVSGAIEYGNTDIR